MKRLFKDSNNKVAEKIISSKEIDIVGNEEYFRIGVLVNGISIDNGFSNSINPPALIPRFELCIGESKRHTTVRLNSNSPFLFNKNTLSAKINSSVHAVHAEMFNRLVGDKDYSFSPIRANGDSLVFDWVHSFCDYFCKFCFKEYDWVIQKSLGISHSKESEIERNIEYISEYLLTGKQNDYSVIWLCTGSLSDPLMEREQHLKVLDLIRSNKYSGRVFMSSAPPKDIVFNKEKSLKVFNEFKNHGLDRLNSGMELVNTKFRKEYIKGFKGSLTCKDYCHFLENAKCVFGNNVGSCVLVGLEPHNNSLEGLLQFSKRGIQSVPTIYTSFVKSQLNNKVFGDVDEFVRTSLSYKDMIKRYNIEIFKSVFGLV
ncbi:MAG: hypothetical protein Q8L29_02800 [archaeon]|nr:hypothetical protein [archaeon]